MSGRYGHKWGLLLFQRIHPEGWHWLREVFARKRWVPQVWLWEKTASYRGVTTLVAAFCEVIVRTSRKEVSRRGSGTGYYHLASGEPSASESRISARFYLQHTSPLLPTEIARVNALLRAWFSQNVSPQRWKRVRRSVVRH